MRLLAVLLALLVLTVTVNAVWEHSTDILVRDYQGRSVPHAKVTVTWQLSERDQKHEEVGYTDYRGLFRINMTNYVQVSSQVSYIVSVKAEYGGGSVFVSGVNSFNVKAHPDPVPISLSLSKVKVNVLTPYGWPVNGATIYIAPWTFKTDSSGSATFLLPPVIVGAVVVLNDMTTTAQIYADKDVDVNITLNVYRLTIHVVNQDGASRTAVVLVDGVSYPSDSRGTVVFNPFPGQVANLIVESMGTSRNVQVNMTTDKEIWVQFDTIPPKIIDVARTAIKDNYRQIVARITEEGEFASGLQSVTLYWTVNETEQSPLEMYLLDATTFAATLPPQSEDTAVVYYVTAKDKQGNSASSKKESYGSKLPVQPQNNQTQDGNQTSDGSGNLLSIGPINWWLVIGVATVLIIAIVIYIYIRED